MDAYFGTDKQIMLQELVDANLDWLRSTPGACNIGRFLGTDDPARLRWQTVNDMLEAAGIFGFRLIASSETADAEQRIAGKGFRIDWWDVFSADADAVRDALAGADLALPDGFRLLEAGEAGEPETIRRAQGFMAENGIAPLSATMLSGANGPATLTIIVSPDGAIAATAFGYFPHNAHSRHAGSAWGGLVAVDPDLRGQRLGFLVNAAMVRAMIDDLGATSVYELVSETNVPSRRMVERCGLELDASVKSGLASPVDAERFTR